MARLHQSGFELNSLTVNVEWQTVASTGITIDGTAARSGSFGLHVASMSSATRAGVLFKFLSAAAGGPYYLRGYLKVVTPPSGSNHIMSLNGNNTTVGNSPNGKVTLETNGTLILRNSAGTSIGSASSAVNDSNWHLIELQHNGTPASGSRVTEARLDGSVFATSSTQTDSNVLGYSIGGNLDAEVNTTGEWYWDDVAVNDSTGSFQKSYPGPGKIIHLRPNAAGDINGYLVQVGGTAGSANNFTRVNEVTPNDATSYNASAVLNAEDLFNVDNSGIGVNDRVNVVMVGGREANLVSADATSGIKYEIIKASGGTKLQSTNLIVNSTTWNSNIPSTPHNYPIITYQDPDGANWTQTTLDSMQVGYTIDTVGVQSIAITIVYASVDYTPASSGNFLSFF